MPIDIYKPQCEKPMLLVNQYIIALVQQGAKVYLAGREEHRLPPLHKLLETGRSISDEEKRGYYVQLSEHIVEPIYMYVPCMDCILCRHSKQVDLINRSILETLTWDVPPVFFTLTYRDADLPCLKVGNQSYEVGELRYKDVQDFFKRLRIRWTRKGLSHDIRYLVAGEYGSKTGRCHYHVIMWNNPYHADENNYLLFSQLSEDVFQAWGHADSPAFDFRQCRGGAAPYATKYVTKPQVTHGHHVRPFIRCSSGKRGGLGSIFLKNLIPYLRENPQLNYLDYVDKRGKYCYMFFSKSITSKVWPSPSRCVNARKRDYYRQLEKCLQMLIYIRQLSYDDALEVARCLKPSKHIAIKLEMPQFLSPNCPLYISFFFKELQRVYNDLTFELSNVTDEISDSYINNLYSRRLLMPKIHVEDTAQKVSKLRIQQAVMLDKEIF